MMIKYLAIALILIVASPTKVAHAESISSTTVLNGLSTPTASQRFFEEGRRQFEQEEQKFRDNVGFSGENLLKLPKNFDFTTPKEDRDRELLLQPEDLSKLP